MNIPYNSAFSHIESIATNSLKESSYNQNYYGINNNSHQRINSKISIDKSIADTNNSIIRKNTGIHGVSSASNIINELDKALNFNHDYLLKQKLQNSNTYNKIKSSVVFQNEFLAHVRLNSLSLSNIT